MKKNLVILMASVFAFTACSSGHHDGPPKAKAEPSSTNFQISCKDYSGLRSFSVGLKLTEKLSKDGKILSINSSDFDADREASLVEVTSVSSFKLSKVQELSELINMENASIHILPQMEKMRAGELVFKKKQIEDKDAIEHQDAGDDSDAETDLDVASGDIEAKEDIEDANDDTQFSEEGSNAQDPEEFEIDSSELKYIERTTAYSMQVSFVDNYHLSTAAYLQLRDFLVIQKDGKGGSIIVPNPAQGFPGELVQVKTGKATSLEDNEEMFKVNFLCVNSAVSPPRVK